MRTNTHELMKQDNTYVSDTDQIARRTYLSLVIHDKQGNIQANIDKIKSAIEETQQGWKAEATRLAEILQTRRAAHASEPFDAAKHHPSCTPNDQDLMWVCAQCGHREPAQARECVLGESCPMHKPAHAGEDDRPSKRPSIEHGEDYLPDVPAHAGERPYNDELATVMLTEGDLEGLAHEVSRPNKPAHASEHSYNIGYEHGATDQRRGDEAGRKSEMRGVNKRRQHLD